MLPAVGKQVEFRGHAANQSGYALCAPVGDRLAARSEDRRTASFDQVARRSDSRQWVGVDSALDPSNGPRQRFRMELGQGGPCTVGSDKAAVLVRKPVPAECVEDMVASCLVMAGLLGVGLSAVVQ